MNREHSSLSEKFGFDFIGLNALKSKSQMELLESELDIATMITEHQSLR